MPKKLEFLSKNRKIALKSLILILINSTPIPVLFTKLLILISKIPEKTS